jgi:hypothetical protein
MENLDKLNIILKQDFFFHQRDLYKNFVEFRKCKESQFKIQLKTSSTSVWINLDDVSMDGIPEEPVVIAKSSTLAIEYGTKIKKCSEITSGLKKEHVNILFVESIKGNDLVPATLGETIMTWKEWLDTPKYREQLKVCLW